MSSEPLISIIIPVYNVGAYLTPCLESLLAQTEPRWEAICIDDGSTDGSGDVLENFARRDSRFVVIRKENEGVSRTRNRGMREATAPLITMLDADDAFTPEAVSTIIRHAKEDPDFILFGGCQIDEAGHTQPFRLLKENYKARGCVSVSARLAAAVEGYCWGGAYKTDLLRRHQLEYDESIRYFEDHHFLLRYLAHCRRAYISDEPLYCYYLRSGSASAQWAQGKGALADYIKMTDMLPSVLRAILPVFPPEEKQAWNEMLFVRHCHFLVTPLKIAKKLGFAAFACVAWKSMTSLPGMMRGLSPCFICQALWADLSRLLHKH